MINVVFLLLIFFLMTATISPPEPFEISAPESATEQPAESDLALYMDSQGLTAWSGQQGDAAIAALLASGIGRSPDTPLIVRADRGVPAVEIARLLRRLAFGGVVNAQLVTVASQ